MQILFCLLLVKESFMKRRLFLVVSLLALLSVPAYAESNFVAQFLNRYRGVPVSTPANPGMPAQDPLADLIRAGVLPLSITDVINLTLQNNLDINVNRLTPLSTRYLIESSYRPFEPT